MKITDVRVSLRDTDALKAFVSIVIDDVFIIKTIKIIQGKDKLFVSMPTMKGRKGQFIDIAHPLNTETRTEMEEMIMAAYQEALKNQEENPTVETPTQEEETE
jgi:stage V sporulation protein G